MLPKHAGRSHQPRTAGRFTLREGWQNPLPTVARLNTRCASHFQAHWLSSCKKRRPLLQLLSSPLHPQVAGRGLSGIACGGTTRSGQRHRPAHGERTPSSLRSPSRRLRRHSQGAISPTCAWRMIPLFASMPIAGNLSLRISFRAARPSHAPNPVGSFRNLNSICDCVFATDT